MNHLLAHEFKSFFVHVIKEISSFQCLDKSDRPRTKYMFAEKKTRQTSIKMDRNLGKSMFDP